MILASHSSGTFQGNSDKYVKKWYLVKILDKCIFLFALHNLCGHLVVSIKVTPKVLLLSTCAIYNYSSLLLSAIFVLQTPKSIETLSKTFFENIPDYFFSRLPLNVLMFIMFSKVIFLFKKMHPFFLKITWQWLIKATI